VGFDVQDFFVQVTADTDWRAEPASPSFPVRSKRIRDDRLIVGPLVSGMVGRVSLSRNSHC